MPSSLFPQNSNTNGIGDLIQRYSDFKRTFSGNPEQMVRSLIASGKMSQTQFEQLAETARQLQSILK